MAAAALQIACGVVFIWDVASEWQDMDRHSWAELAAIAGLILGAMLALRELRKVMQRNARVESQLAAASGAFQTVLDQHFETWGLTPAERDVALLSIKGVSVADIARMRDTRDGTIKAQSTAIYRKAGVSNRAELISVVIEDVIAGLGVPAKT